jgi:hypothetical protein
MKLATSAVAPAVLAAALGGCGLGAGPGAKNASLNITENFGSATLGTATQKRVPGSETDMQLLQRYEQTTTRHGGRFVQSIDGHSGTGGRDDWFYYVNGIEAPKRASATQVHKGDHVWWDLHDWTATQEVPAVVGAYPEPFTNGTGGQRLPTVLICAGATQACNVVAASLRRAGIKAADQSLGTGSGSDSLAVLVGSFKALRGVIASDLIAAGPAKSGVYAQFVGSGGQAMELDNPEGQVTQTLHGTAGLVAATEQPSLNEPVWFVTGTDSAGVEEAARTLTPAKLHDHFAVVVTGSREIPVPLDPGQ